jgi:8-oxo-dGTP pyrophosphatase MutT (NUDIX family)
MLAGVSAGAKMLPHVLASGPKNMHSRTVAPTTYDEVLRRNIRALRNRAGFNQALVVERMRNLGYSSWHRQTMGNIERGDRRVLAEEIFGLAHALETTIAALLNPVPDDKVVEFPSGAAISVWSVQELVSPGLNVGQVAWVGGGAEPEFYLVEVAGMAEAALRREEIQRRAVVAVIVTSVKGMLITERKDGKPPYGFVTGEMEPGERPEDAAIRETKEETSLEVRTGRVIGEQDHPRTGRHMIYMAAKPVRSTKVIVGDEAELAGVRWASLDEAMTLMPDMFRPVREYLAAELAGGQ